MFDKSRKSYLLLVAALFSFMLISAPVYAVDPGSDTSSNLQAQGKPVDNGDNKKPGCEGRADCKRILWVVDASAYLIIAVLVIFIAFAYKSDWSLTDALSEKVEVLQRNDKGELKLDGLNKPVVAPELRASSSRLIAFIGMLVILVMYSGFGVAALNSYIVTGQLPEETDNIVTFLMSGMTLFAPYVVNKFSGIMKPADK